MLSQQLLNGVITGSIYALFVLGFTLVFSVHRLLNLAHGGVFMVGAFVGYWTVLQGLPIWIAAPIAALVAGLVSAAIQLVALHANDWRSAGKDARRRVGIVRNVGRQSDVTSARSSPSHATCARSQGTIRCRRAP